MPALPNTVQTNLSGNPEKNLNTVKGGNFLRKALLFVFLVLGVIPCAFAQTPNGAYSSPTGGGLTLHGSGAPSNPCAAGTTYTNDSTGQLYSCNAGTWTLISAGGGVTASAGQTLYASGTNAASGGTI